MVLNKLCRLTYTGIFLSHTLKSWPLWDLKITFFFCFGLYLNPVLSSVHSCCQPWTSTRGRRSTWSVSSDVEIGYFFLWKLTHLPFFPPLVFLDATNIWWRFDFFFLFFIIHRNWSGSFFFCGRCDVCGCSAPSQGRARWACRFTPTCSKKTTSPGRGCCCSQRATCETWGSSPKATSCILRQDINVLSPTPEALWPGLVTRFFRLLQDEIEKLSHDYLGLVHFPPLLKVRRFFL